MSDKWRMEQSPREITFTYKGEEVTIQVKPMTWSKKNQILSNSMSYSSDGEVKFNWDRFNKECLTYMIVQAPWGKTDNMFLTSIDDELGNQLQRLIPAPFEMSGSEDFLGSESEESSQETSEEQT